MLCRPFTILTVCTGNICRSPAMAVVLHEALRGATPDVSVTSAGTRAVVGSGIHPFTAAALAEHGLHVGDHVARQLSPARVAGADLVLTAERGHRVQVVQADSSAVPRTFTIAEFARLAALVTNASGTPDRSGSTSLRDLVSTAAELRAQARPDQPFMDDLADPVRGGRRDHQDMVDRVADLVGSLRANLHSTRAPRSAESAPRYPRRRT